MKKMKPVRVLLMVLLSFTLALTVTQPSLAAEKVIRWGVTSSLQAEAGIGAKNGTLMAAEEINAAGGILGYKVECFFADDEMRPEVGIRAVRKLIFDDKVDVVSGGWLSGVGLAQAPHIFDAKKLWLSVGPSSPKFSDMVKEDYERAKYFFRVGAPNTFGQAENMATFASNFYKGGLGLTKIALMAENTVWAREAVDILDKAFLEKGMTIVYRDIFDPKRTDFSPQFAQIRGSGGEILFTIQAAAPGVAFVNQWRDTELPLHLAGYITAAMVSNFWDKTGGKCYAQVCQLGTGGRTPLSPKTIPFHDKYQAKYGTVPVYTAYGQYDAMYMFKQVAEKANSLDTDRLIKAFETAEYIGAQGVTRFTKDHELVMGGGGRIIPWAQWMGPGRLETIYPSQYSSAKHIFPAWVKKK